MMDWLCKNWLNLGLLCVGSWAIIQYHLQKKDKLQSAATIVKLQIDNIEGIIKRLQENYENKGLSNPVIYKIPEILPVNEWNNYKHILVKKLLPSDIILIDAFYLASYQLDMGRKDLMFAMRQMWIAKTEKEANIIYEAINKNELQSLEKNDVIRIKTEVQEKINALECHEHVFIPTVALESLTNRISHVKSLLGTTTYVKLEKLSS